jgi:hypothetical protein
MQDLGTRFGRVAGTIGFEEDDLAHVLEESPGVVSQWLAGKTAPSDDAHVRLLEVLAVLELLSGVLEPQAAHDWLFKPSPLLNKEKPIEVLREGGYRRVQGAIEAMAEGVFL